MTTIAQLSAASSLSGGDAIPLASQSQGDTRRASLTDLLAWLQSQLKLSGGILAASSVYAMNAAGLAPNVGTAYGNITGQNPLTSVILPTGAGSLAVMAANGEFIATRDIQAALVNVNIAMTYAAARFLTLAILTGPDATPYETPLHFGGIGQAAAQMYANFTGLVYNPNNAGGYIKAGEKIRLVAKFDVGAVLTIQSLSTQVQTLDGV